MPDERSKLVYSTAKTIPKKEKPAGKAGHSGIHPAEQRVIVRVERKGRGGKSVTIIEGLRISQNQKEMLLRQLKARLGTGGNIRNTALEIQGDHCDTLIDELGKMGCRPKRSGG